MRSITKLGRGNRWLNASNISMEQAILLAMLVAAVFLGIEIFDHASEQLFASEIVESTTSVPLLATSTLSVGPRGELTVQAPRTRWQPVGQVLLAGMFVCVTTGFVAQSAWRRRQERTVLGAKVASQTLATNELENVLFLKRHDVRQHLAGDDFLRALQGFTVDRIMTTHVTVARPNMSYGDIHRIMLEHKLRHVVVCSSAHTILGVISDRDVLTKGALTAQELMTRDPICVPPTASVLAAVSIMLDHRVACLPVVQGEKLVGTINSTDLHIALQSLLQVLHSKLLASSGDDA